MALAILTPAVVFAGYLAQRERSQVSQGDYLVDYKISWRRSAIMLGGLSGQAMDLLKG